MTNVFFMHQIKHNKTENTWDKGIVVKAAVGEVILAAAKQAFHAYLGAYAYGHDATVDYVSCKITNLAGAVIPHCDETWSETPVDEDNPAE